MAKKNNNKLAIRKDSDKNVSRLNRAIYSATDPTYGYPTGFGVPAVGARAGIALLSPDNMWYEVKDSVADAAWRKRLGLSYDEKFLRKNKNGSYRLPKNLEMEIPTDTIALKRRIQANRELANSPEIMGENWQLVQGMIKEDEKTLDALRRTYKTGEPVVINEYTHNSRKLAKDGKIVKGAKDYKSPLNVLQNYTIQYDPITRTMKYRDVYDFNEFESFVPGEPFDIEGEIPLRRYDFGGWFKDITGKFKDATGKLDNWNTKVTDKFMNSDFGQGLSNLGIKSKNIGGIANIGSTVIGGLLAGKNQSGVGNAMQQIGSLASNIPGVGGLIGAGVNMVGGLVNATFGSNINEEFVQQTEQDIQNQSNYLSTSSTNEQLLNEWGNFSQLGHVSKSDVGSEGWLSNKATDKTNSLNNEIDIANARALASLGNTATNIDKQNDLMLLANSSAYGGPIDMKYTGIMSPFGNQFKYGGIHIKPSHRGRLTELKARTGKSEAELYNDGNPAHKKMVVFARNARKWKHADGGPIEEGIKKLVNNTWEERKTWNNLLRGLPLLLNNRKPEYGKGELGGGGANSSFFESPDTYSLVKDTIWVPYRETFNDAFGRARSAGLDEFMFDNKLYNTELGDNPDNIRAGEERAIEGLLPVERTKKVKNEKADGGSLFTNGITTINNGGTHEQSPLEGVPMGVDSEGVPNLVEEGEVIWNDYVFSNRLRVPKEVRQKYKLRGVTFADAAKQIQKESEERPNDPISKNGLDAMMNSLMEEQEMVREAKNKNKYAKGGKLGRLYGGSGLEDQWLELMPKTGAVYDSKFDVTSRLPIAPVKNSKLRYAPIIGSGMAVFNDLLGGNEADYSNADMYARAIANSSKPITFTPLGDYMSYKPVDIESYKNRLAASAASNRRGVLNTSGGNRATAMAGLLAADYNYGNQLGSLINQIEGINWGRNKEVMDYNRATRMANNEMAMKADMANAEQAMKRASMYGSLAQYRDAIRDKNRAEKSANLTNFLTNIGNLGREITDRDMLRWLQEKGVLKASNGGKINRKKRGGFTV